MMTRQESIEHEFVQRLLKESMNDGTLLTAVFFKRDAVKGLTGAVLVEDNVVSKKELLVIANYLLARAQDCAKGLNA